MEALIKLKLKIFQCFFSFMNAILENEEAFLTFDRHDVAYSFFSSVSVVTCVQLAYLYTRAAQLTARRSFPGLVCRRKNICNVLFYFIFK